jgi:hypothetical protein
MTVLAMMAATHGTTVRSAVRNAPEASPTETTVVDQRTARIAGANGTRRSMPSPVVGPGPRPRSVTSGREPSAEDEPVWSGWEASEVVTTGGSVLLRFESAAGAGS